MARALRPGRLAGLTGAGRRGAKYGNVTTAYRDAVYDSKLEASVAARNDLLVAAGRLGGWRRGREWVLVDAPKKRDRIALIPDFELWDGPRETDGFRVLDAKGVLTGIFRLKLKIWKAVYPTIPFWIIKADGKEVRM